MGQSVHSREELEALGREITAEQYRHGIVIMNPHQEAKVRRERNKRLSFQLWPESLADRARNIITYLKKTYGSDLGLEIACKRLERVHPEENEMEET